MNDFAIQERAPSTELVDPKVLTPAAVFTVPGGVDAILKQITERVRAFKGDMSTAIGRKEIASFAFKVSRSKTLLDGWGKKLGEDHYKSWKAITAERTRIEGALDALRDAVRKPLDDWEKAEADRVAAHEDALGSLKVACQFTAPEPTVAAIEGGLAWLNDLNKRDWQEFSVRAAETTEASRKTLLAMRDATIKREADRAELKRLLQEQADRERKQREDKIAAEAAERAKQEAEAKAKCEADAQAAKEAAEKQRIEREKADAIARAEAAEAAKIAAAEQADRDRIAAAEKTERDRKAAAEKAERDQLAAIEAERKRIADEKAAAEEAAAKREANTRHVGKINKAAAEALVIVGLESKLAYIVVAAIARGEIPGVRISY